jgi:outer membrane protein assembly factor BamB
MNNRLAILALLAPALAPLAALDAPRTGLPAAAEADWPWWRGPALDGKSRGAKAPLRWGAKENVVWRTPLPGSGHSSPVLWGERIFLTTADESARTQSVLALDRTSGKVLWTTVAHKGPLPRKNPKNSHASATPACDGTRVFSVFLGSDALHVTATDLDGKILWQEKAGGFRSEHGYGASPVLHGDLVIVSGDSLAGCFLAGLDRSTGKVVWKADRKATGRHGDYATPIIATLAGKPQLILMGLGEVSSYDPRTGKRLWNCKGPSEVTGCTPAFSDTLVFATGGYPEKNLLAIRADGSGDVTDTHVAWRSNSGVAYVPSPLYHDGLLYLVSDGGVATCFEAKSGKQLWQERLAGAFTSSPVLAGGRVYVTNESGRTHVFEAGRTFRRAATNDLGERVLATPAICGGRVYLRTSQALYCIGE